MAYLKQVIYVDVLVALNIIVSFLLIKSVCCLIREKPSAWRVLSGSLLGGVYSLCIFLPPMNTAVVLLARLLFLCVVSFVVFGFGYWRRFFRCLALLCAVTLVFAGLVIGVWLVFRPQSLLVRNGSVYLDVSFITLVLAGTAVYILAGLFGKFLSHRHRDDIMADITITYKGKTIRARGIIDTGNNLTDTFTGKAVNVIDQSLALELLPAEYAAAAISPMRGAMPQGMHLIVSDTVGGTVLMSAFSVDRIEVNICDGFAVIEGAAVAVSSQTEFGPGCSVLLNADLANNIKGGREYGKKTGHANKRAALKAEGQRGSLHKRPSDASASVDSSAGEGGYAADRARR